MEWTILKNQGCIIVNDQKYCLRHLNDMKIQLTIASDEKYKALSFELLVQFSSHCVSIGPKANEAFVFDNQNISGVIIDHRGIRRMFCENRYQLSYHLSAVFETILERMCFFTGHDNWMTIEFLNKEGVRHEYEVFFRLYRESKNFLRLYVESAYVRDLESRGRKPAHLKKSQKVRGKTLLAKKLRGEPIKRPR